MAVLGENRSALESARQKRFRLAWRNPSGSSSQGTKVWPVEMTKRWGMPLMKGEAETMSTIVSPPSPSVVRT